MESPLPLHEFNPAPVAVAAPVATPDANCLDTSSVEFGSNPFGPSFTQNIPVKGSHITLGLVIQYDEICRQCQLLNMK